VVPPAFKPLPPLDTSSILKKWGRQGGGLLACTITGATRFSYGVSLCENNVDEGDFIIWLIVSHYPTTL
jgi:hypothetical protein